MEKWKNGKMEKWKNGKMEKWKNGMDSDRLQGFAKHGKALNKVLMLRYPAARKDEVTALKTRGCEGGMEASQLWGWV